MSLGHVSGDVNLEYDTSNTSAYVAQSQKPLIAGASVDAFRCLNEMHLGLTILMKQYSAMRSYRHKKPTRSKLRFLPLFGDYDIDICMCHR